MEVADEVKDAFLFKEAQFSYHVLTKTHRDQALALVARAFLEEPTTNGVTEEKPEMKCTFIDLVEFTDPWMDDASSNGLSVVVIDEKTHRIIGAAINIDASIMPDGFIEKYTKNDKALSHIVSLLGDMKEEAEKVMPELATIPGNVCDLFMLAVHPDYVGRGVGGKVFKASLPLLIQAGFKYATVIATNAFTSKIASSLKCDLLYQIEVKDWKWKGEHIYTNVKQPHGCAKFWVKELSCS